APRQDCSQDTQRQETSTPAHHVCGSHDHLYGWESKLRLGIETAAHYCMTALTSRRDCAYTCCSTRRLLGLLPVRRARIERSFRRRPSTSINVLTVRTGLVQRPSCGEETRDRLTGKQGPHTMCLEPWKRAAFLSGRTTRRSVRDDWNSEW